MTNKRRITVEDLYNMKWISDPQISPDGSLIAYVLKTVDPKDKMKYQNHIWMVPTDGSREAYQFTNLCSSETNPRWSPDSKTLIFTAKRDEFTQAWSIPVAGGAPLEVTDNRFNTGAPVWSPDGTKIAYTAKVKPESDCNEAEKSDVKYIDKLFYKLNGTGFLDNKVSQLFVTDINSGDTTQLTKSEFAVAAPSWSPCSKFLAFSSNRTEDAEYNNLTDIWTIDLKAENLTKITTTGGRASSPSWSPNGKYIAYIGDKMEHGSATISTIYLINLASKEEINLLPNLETAPRHAVGGDSVSSPSNGLIWSKNNKHIYFNASMYGKTALYKVETTKEAKLTKLTEGDEVLYGMSYSDESKTFAVTRSSFITIGDLFVIDDNNNRRQLTDVNSALLAEVELSQPEQFKYNYDRFEIEGWIMKPYGFKEGETYPTILEIHGGPHAAYGHIFFHEFQLLAAKGYTVVFTNPPGSSNYGQDFYTQTHHDWGGLDYRSLMAAVDYVNENYNYVAKDNWGVTGGSYGGYMVNWMIGQTDFFKAGVSLRSTCNRYSQFGTSDVGFFNGNYEQKGNPWDNAEFYLKVSPLTYVNNVKTPLMLIHSENDLRCPISQAEEFFSALKWLKKEVVMVRFPNETHELSRAGKPKHRIERLNYLLGWFTDHIKISNDMYSN
ncbi:S9 family peptidase [Clostridium sp. 'deep sea']|uniref:S9 family peptidase n=1 Tax=Clostridium sp. 'deep sea' TaxID=2779445 RepID=UPI0018966240|nr:S9 family peptidase [Clostridium sp. 'deep sea']QOR36586.1 S9 family peptidase [Clostridium sp. 'deep sea']